MADPSYGKVPEIYGYQTLWREIGYYISRLERYERSLRFFDEAIKKTPNDRRALIGRGKARAKACQYAGALEDVNKALQIDPDDIVVLAHKALNTYLSCEFEEGLVQNTRLLPRRQKPEHFSMGVMHCTIAIENCIGERAGRPLRDHFRIIRRLAWKWNYEAQKPYEPTPRRPKKKKKKHLDVTDKHIELVQGTLAMKRKSLAAQTSVLFARSDEDEDLQSIVDSLHSAKSDGLVIPPFTQPFPFRPMQRYTSNIENYMAEKYLDSMYREKIFLKQLQHAHGAKSPNQRGSEKIKKLAKDGFKYVSYKQELLRTRRPFYHIKYQDAKSSGKLKMRQESELLVQQQITKKEADVLLERLYTASSKKQLQQVLQLSEKLKLYCDMKPKRLLPDKDKYIKEIIALIRKGFYQLNRLNKDQLQCDQSKRIYVMFNMPLSREPSQDSVIEQFKGVYLDYKKMIELFEGRLQVAEELEEMCWCLHELGRFYIETKKWELARVYCKKCIQEASKPEGNLEWVVNASMLMIRANIDQHNKNDARSDLQTVMTVADMLHDEDLKEFLGKCMEVVEEIEFDDSYGPKVLHKRQEKMLSLMTTAKMKDEFAHLLRTMAALPASRRMAVMPGVRVDAVEEKKDSDRKKSKAKMSKLVLVDGDSEKLAKYQSKGLVGFVDEGDEE